MNIVAILVLVAILAALIFLFVRHRSQATDTFADAAAAAQEQPGSVKDLITEMYSDDAIWDTIYDDAYTIQTRYLSTLEKADATIDARAELERVAGVPALRCIPAEVARILDRRPGTVADVREYYACLPTAGDFETLMTYIVNEMKMALANSMKALSGDISYTGGPVSAVGEGFAAAAMCDPVAICNSLVANTKAALAGLGDVIRVRTLAAEKREEIRRLLDDGLAAMKKVDEMNTSAQAGTLPVAVPIVG